MIFSQKHHDLFPKTSRCFSRPPALRWYILEASDEREEPHVSSLKPHACL
jgi:hypothetical protein